MMLLAIFDSYYRGIEEVEKEDFYNVEGIALLK